MRCSFIIFLAAGIGCGGSTPEESATTTTTASSSSAAGGEDATETSTGSEDRPEPSADATPDNEFRLNTSGDAGQARGERPSEIQATRTHAAMRLFVVDHENTPLPGIVIKMTGADGASHYSRETDSTGYAELLVPNGQRYAMEYLSLGRQMTTAQVPVAADPNLDVRLTLRYRRHRPPPLPAGAPPATGDSPERFVLEGIEFDSGRATIRPESNARLDRVVEYLTHKPDARIRIAGYTDNVGNARVNQRLSEQRAQAVRAYLVSHGIDAGRVEAVGFGAESPIASNDTEEGRQQNRRIEATEL